MDARKTVLAILTMIEIVTEILYWFFPFKNDRSERNCFRISGIISIIWLVFCMYFFKINDQLKCSMVALSACYTHNHFLD